MTNDPSLDLLTFSDALIRLAEGRPMARLIWLDPDDSGNIPFVYLQHGTYPAEDGGKYPDVVADELLSETLFKPSSEYGAVRLPHINMVSPSGEIIVGWLPTILELFAADWIEVPYENKFK